MPPEGLRPLPPSAKVESGRTIVFFADECIKEYAVRANESATGGGGRKLFDMVHQSFPSSGVKPGVGVPSQPAPPPFWVSVKADDKAAFDLQLASLRDPTWRKRGRDGDAPSPSSSSSAASSIDEVEE